jgi:phosphate transport system substrate-binding protein
MKEVRMKVYLKVLVVLAVLLASTVIGLAANENLIGAGATFPYPLYSKMFDVYSKEQGVMVNYQAIGSGGGIRQLINKTVDFGGSDAIMSDEDTKAAGAPVVHIPTCAGAVVITYQLPGNPEMRFTPDLVGDIFLGKITKWNDQRIVAQNPGMSLPDLPITVIHRSDGSGTTNIFSDYLSRVSPEWKSKVGEGTALNWPTGLGAKGNPGVAGLVRQTPGACGYVELIYAIENKMPFGQLRNQKGKFIRATLASTSAAANIPLPADMKVHLTDTIAAEGYPITGFTFILLYKDQKYGEKTMDKAKAVVNLVWWMIHDGQKYAEPLDYAPLSRSAQEKAERLLESITYGGTPLLKQG